MRARSPLTVTSLVALLLVSVGSNPDPAAAGGADRLAPSFTLRTLDGKSFRLQEQRGRPVVLDFWATWCAPCRASMPHLDRLQERYTRDGLVVLGLSVDEDPPASVKRFAERLGIKFRLAMADEKLLDRYGPIRMLPTTFFINRRGEVVRRTVGYLDAETLDAYVRELF
ncbi:MAG: TlpA disulfide reductase family protein [Candidatus Eisenbacteria bacterium]